MLLVNQTLPSYLTTMIDPSPAPPPFALGLLFHLITLMLSYFLLPSLTLSPSTVSRRESPASNDTYTYTQIHTPPQTQTCYFDVVECYFISVMIRGYLRPWR